MKTTPSDKPRGIALIIVMIAIVVLSLLAAAFAYSMKVETKLAQNSNSEDDLFRIGRTGVHNACWRLAGRLTIPDAPFDSLDQDWAGGANDTNGVSEDIQWNHFDLDNGHGDVTIEDMERKVNINMADEAMLQQALTLVGVDASQISTTTGAILDWIDPDDNTHIDGAESDYYQGLDPPYMAKNAPIDDLSELLLVKGVTTEIFWGGNASAGHRQAVFQNPSRKAGMNQEPLSYPVGLMDIFTPVSNGKININTASETVLQMIPGVDAAMASSIVQMRSEAAFRNVGELINVPGMSQQLVQQFQRVCDVRSHSFKVTVDAQVGGYHRYFTAIVGRNSPQDTKILTFNWSEQPENVTASLSP